MKLVKDVQLRRYTPPTCTLELWQTRRVWQRTPQTLPPDYRFALHFDDPRLPEVEQLTLSGTPEELETLAVAVESYLQQRLSPCASLEPSTYPEPIFNADGEPSFCLRPQGSWSHELLGMGAPVILNTSQLYDLMLALESFRLQDLEPSRMPPAIAGEKLPQGLIVGGVMAAGGVLAIAMATLWMRQPQGVNNENARHHGCHSHRRGPQGPSQIVIQLFLRLKQVTHFDSIIAIKIHKAPMRAERRSLGYLLRMWRVKFVKVKIGMALGLWGDFQIADH
ncbi:DUF4335 domain-containing protein, partial [Synechocystis sp. LEGE 06083]|uniref:DUF4335 domain-containing protein n=1 Tax=Synechocystis sp. LEGE 06083 TaxID=915336 RepID=UPI001D14340C